jgi:hypothetical protein
MKKIVITFIKSVNVVGPVPIKTTKGKTQGRHNLQTPALYTATIVLAFLVCFSFVNAGSLTPPGVPEATMKTLQDIYLRLTTGATAGSHMLSPAGSPAGTMYTLDQIYSAIPTTQTNNITVTNNSGTTILAGIYNGTPKCVAGLTGGTGTAAANAQVLSGYYAYTSNGTALTGSASAGYAYGDSSAGKVLTTASGNGGASSYDATNLVDTNNVKLGVTYGVGQTGTYNPTCSDANLLSNDIKDNVAIFGVTGNIGLPKTGQTTSYGVSQTCADGGTGNCDDGYYKKGAPHSPVARFTDNSDSTITDNATGLMWEKCSEGLSGTGCLTGSISYLTWQNAINRCDNSTSNGHSDWRLPNIKELQSIVDYGTYSPAISTVFPNTQSNRYWSSTTGALDTSYAWYVYFDDGSVYSGGKTSGSYVRCVRQ